MKGWKRNVIVGASTVIVAFGLLQLVPYRVSNPPVTGEPNWDGEYVSPTYSTGGTILQTYN